MGDSGFSGSAIHRGSTGDRARVWSHLRVGKDECMRCARPEASGRARIPDRIGVEGSARRERPKAEKRWGRDSNPRRGGPLTGFQDRCIQPLCHPTGGFQGRQCASTVHDTALRRGGLCPFAASRTPSAPRPACTVAVRRLSGRPRRAARHQRQGRGNVPSGAASLIHQRGARRAGSKSRSCLCVSPSLSTSPPGVPQQANRCSRPAVSTSPSPSKSAGHSGGRNSPAPEFTPGGRREEGGEGFVCLVEADGEAVSAGMWLFLLLE